MKYIPEHYYHAYNRGDRKQKIFFDIENYHFLLHLCHKYIARYRVTIAAYCFMPNHYHFMLKQNMEGNIGMFLKTVFNSYTQAINKRYGYSGTLFQGQVKVKHVDTEKYILQLIRYIHLNPVEARLVSSPEEWQFSNYREWIGRRNSEMIDVTLFHSFFSSHSMYMKFVEKFRNDNENIGKYLFNEK
jgi:putative transposase